MEFPHIGDHCSMESCKKLDFLPVKCDVCLKIFCGHHMRYVDHNCTEADARNVQVPVCPICDKPIPSKRGELPDVAVGAHIDRDCQSGSASTNSKAYIHKCSSKGCKKKELVRFPCSNCQLNHCISHRHPSDHQCKSRHSSQENQGSATTVEVTPTNDQKSYLLLQGSMSEDEALARALTLSFQDGVNTPDDKPEDKEEDKSKEKSSCSLC